MGSFGSGSVVRLQSSEGLAEIGGPTSKMIYSHDFSIGLFKCPYNIGSWLPAEQGERSSAFNNLVSRVAY